jgi:hypothetical protein
VPADQCSNLQQVRDHFCCCNCVLQCGRKFYNNYSIRLGRNLQVIVGTLNHDKQSGSHNHLISYASCVRSCAIRYSARTAAQHVLKQPHESGSSILYCNQLLHVALTAKPSQTLAFACSAMISDMCSACRRRENSVSAEGAREAPSRMLLGYLGGSALQPRPARGGHM